jgi:hypothetical protein
LKKEYLILIGVIAVGLVAGAIISKQTKESNWQTEETWRWFKDTLKEKGEKGEFIVELLENDLKEKGWKGGNPWPLLERILKEKDPERWYRVENALREKGWTREDLWHWLEETLKESGDMGEKIWSWIKSISGSREEGVSKENVQEWHRVENIQGIFLETPEIVGKIELVEGAHGLGSHGIIEEKGLVHFYCLMKNVSDRPIKTITLKVVLRNEKGEEVEVENLSGEYKMPEVNFPPGDVFDSLGMCWRLADKSVLNQFKTYEISVLKIEYW